MITTLKHSLTHFPEDSRYVCLYNYNKIPHGKQGADEWQDHTYYHTEIDFKTITGIGRLIERGELIIDIDAHPGGPNGLHAFERFQLDNDINLKPHVETSRGGFHVYCKIDPNFQVPHSLPQYPGIEFFDGHSNRAIPIPNSSCDPKDKKATHKQLRPIERDSISTKCFSIKDQKTTIPYKQIVRYIKILIRKYKKEISYDSWMRVLAAIHDWAGSTPRGEKLAIRFSENVPNYKSPHDVRMHYKSFTTSKDNKVTIATIISEVSQYELKRYSRLISKFTESTYQNQLDTLSQAQLTKPDREQLLVNLQKKLRELKISIPKAELRKLTTPTAIEADVLKRLVFNVPQESIVDTLFPYRDLRPTSFEIMYGHHFPHLKKPFIEVAKQLPVVDGKGYSPSEGQIFYYRRKAKLNIFDPQSMPPCPSHPSSSYDRYISQLLLQFNIFFEDEEIIEVMLDFIAFLYQNPGQKILWAPLLMSEEGMGKSFIGRLCQHILGHENVDFYINPWEASNFNEWQKYKLLNVLEEFDVVKMAKMHKRTVDSLIRDLITGEEVFVDQKYEDKEWFKNVTNYMLFSNSNVPIQLAESDRRFFVFSSTIKDKTDFEMRLLLNGWTTTYDEHWTNLHRMLYEGRDDLIYYFSHRNIAGFKPHTAPPNSYDKQELIHTEARRDERDQNAHIIQEVARICSDEASGWHNKEYVVSEVVFKKIEEDLQILINKRLRHSILLDMDFTEKTHYNVGPKRWYIYHKPSANPAKCRKQLKEEISHASETTSKE